MIVPFLLAFQLSAGAGAPQGWTEAPSLPLPVTNNAVAAVETAMGPAVFSLMGLDESLSSSGELDRVFRLDMAEGGRWREVAPVPGPGRLAATAQGVRGKIYLFGGYTVAEDGTERSVGSVDIYDPGTDSWTAGAPIPVAVDDAVSGVWRDSLVYLVSGWHDTANQILVQLYDPATDVWRQATPIQGPPVFGHAGGIARDAIVYVDGVRVRESDGVASGESRFELQGSAWRGDIHPDDPSLITWRRLPDHPGPALYRAAAVGMGSRVVFLGGSDNPYNYDGVGYDGTPSSPVAAGFAYDVGSDRWSRVSPPWIPTMDHRSAVRVGGYVVLVGGMEAGQRVTDRVQRVTVVQLLTGR